MTTSEINSVNQEKKIKEQHKKEITQVKILPVANFLFCITKKKKKTVKMHLKLCFFNLFICFLNCKNCKSKDCVIF